jgi:NitT/TauT family transport system substrate-binding protein
MLVVGMAAAGASAGALAGSSSTKLTNVTVRLDFYAAGYHSMFYVAKAKGWYKQQGLNVTIEDGQGSLSTVQSVAAGHDTFGYAAPVSMVQAIAAGASVKMVYELQQKDGSGILTKASSGINTPKDLEGKSCVVAPFGYIHSLLPAFYAKTGIDGSKVHIIQAGPTALMPGLIAGKWDAHCDALSWGEVIELRDAGFATKFFSFYKYGIAPLGWGILTSNSEIQSHPDIVRKFLLATAQGVHYQIAHPKQAVDIFYQQDPHAVNGKSIDVQILNAVTKLYVTPTTKGHPLGWSNRQDWIRTEKIMIQYLGLKPAPGVASVYTNRFVPPK